MAADAAPWWNADNPQDGKPLVRHAPSLNHYHNPDQRQLERMRTGIGTPVIVPKATSDGASPAFNAHEAGVVHVDPDAPDGGVIVDLTHLDRRQMRSALAQSAYPHQVFYQLGVPPSLVGKGFGRTAVGGGGDAPRQNPLMPNDYVVPKAAQDGGQQNGYYAHTPGFGPVAPTLVNGYSPPMPTPAYQAAQETPHMFPPVPQLPTAPQPAPPPPQPAAGPAPAPPQVQQYAPPQPQYAPPPPVQQYAPPQPQYQPFPVPMQAVPAIDPGIMSMIAQMQHAMQGLTAGLVSVNQKVGELAAAPPRALPPAAALAARARTRPVDDNPYRQEAGATFDDTAMRPIPRGRQADEEGVGSRRDEQPERRQTLADLKADDEPRDGIIVGFEALKLPYVLGPKGVKPRRQVFFELPHVGSHAVRYHDVIVAKNSLTLVYDTRYEDGDMYVPPEMGDNEITVHLPHLKKTFKVSSVGLSFGMGVFDLIVLPKHAEEALDMGTEDR